MFPCIKEEERISGCGGCCGAFLRGLDMAEAGLGREKYPCLAAVAPDSSPVSGIVSKSVAPLTLESDDEHLSLSSPQPEPEIPCSSLTRCRLLSPRGAGAGTTAREGWTFSGVHSIVSFCFT